MTLLDWGSACLLKFTLFNLKLYYNDNIMFANCYSHMHTCIQIVDREERVAFVGISNWALDPAKMNRGIMVTRCDPEKEELIESAK